MGTRIEEMSQQAAATASGALSKLIGEPMKLGFCSVAVTELERLSRVIDPEELVAVTLLPITGGIRGGTMLVFPLEAAFTLCDLLHKREPGTSQSLSSMDKSALKEIGNIISGNYLAVISNELHLRIIEHIPSFSSDMFGAVMGQALAAFAQEDGKAVIAEVEFIFERLSLRGYLLLLVKSEEIAAKLENTECKEYK